MAKSSGVGFFTVLKVVLYVMISLFVIGVVSSAGGCAVVSGCIKAAPQMIKAGVQSVSSATK